MTRATGSDEPATPAAPPVPSGSGDIQPSPNPKGAFLWESSPSQYIAKVSVATGREILRPIDPEDLLVNAHRDRSPVDVLAQFLASRVIEATGNEESVREGMRRVNALGTRLAERLGSLTGSRSVELRARKLIGVADPDVFYRYREPAHLSEREVRARIAQLKEEARERLKATGRSPRLRLLLTGATGFLGKELLHQAASDRRVAEVVCVVREEKVRDPGTKEVVRVLSPEERGAVLLRRLGVAGARARRFRFVEGDIEKPDLGLAPAEVERLARSTTHVVHCAASVSFDGSYESSFRANVLGCRNALAFSLKLQAARGSRFVMHVAIETSYVHGRKKRSMASEHALVFPRNFYNNYYELTKAMASIETDRHLVERGLRVAQLLPSIVIGHSRTGNNRGDTKVVNAPVNAFGRSKEALDRLRLTPFGRTKAAALASLAMVFPGDRSAELNLVPVDRVAEGILAALVRPEAIGERIHLATDNRIRAEDIVRIAHEELGVDVRLTDPTLFRTLTMPVVRTVLERLDEPRLAGALEKLSSIFGGYGEWGQPVHGVGNDVRVLGLSIRRPDTRNAFRMLCRHNRYVQEYGQVRDPDEVARREAVWEAAIDRIEQRTGRQVASLSADEFRRVISTEIETKGFQAR